MKKTLLVLIILLINILVFGQSNCNTNFVYTVINNNSTFSFTNNSTASGTITNYIWDFGDGAASIDQNPTHVYNTTGTYKVCLTIAGLDLSGNPFMCTYCDNSISAQAYVSPCVANFNYSQITASTFAFVDSSLTTNTIVSYSWTFGDGGVSNLQNPVHSYSTIGTYPVCLIVKTTDGLGNFYSCMFCDTITVSTLVANPCFANFVYSTTNNSTFNFTNLSTSAGNITSYSWSFGDGSSSSLQNPIHSYSNTGKYNACLTIQGIDSMGSIFNCTFCDSVSSLIGNQQCSAFFTYNTFDFSTYNFTSCAIAPGNIIAYDWTFSDGGPSTQQNPSHTYSTNGSFTTCCSITYLNSNSVNTFCNYCTSISVTSIPYTNTCNVTSNIAYTLQNNTVSCAENSSCSNCSFTISKWYFGDGDSSFLANPIHTYSNPGTYNLCLKTVGYKGTQFPCSTDSVCFTIVIHPVSIENSTSLLNLDIYPNPVTSQAIISMPELKRYDLCVKDITGKTLLHEALVSKDKNYNLDMTSFSNGLYYIFLSDENNQYRTKLLKQ